MTTQRPSRTLTGRLSGREIRIPDVDVPPIPLIAPGGVIVNGQADATFGSIGSPARGYPDSRSHRLRLGLLLPATNTVMEHELWSLVFNNQSGGSLDGVGIHTTVVLTPKPDVSTPEGIETYKRSFLGGLEHSVRTALLAAPQYLVLGFSLEHILHGLDSVRDAMAPVETYSDLSWSTWQDAAPAALAALGARRIGLLTPFEEVGNASAIKMFEDLGFEVVASVGMACGNVQHIAHIPDWAKQRAVLEVLATPSNRLDAVVQCGTNMGMLSVIDHVESVSGVPVVAINPVLLWYALREAGIGAPILGGGALLRTC